MSTYSPIASQTLTANAASITFSGIPQGYTDLVIVVKGQGTTGIAHTTTFNGDTGSNYSRAYFYGSGAGAPVSGRATGEVGIIYSVNANAGHTILQINGYSNSTTWKTALWSNDYYTNAVLRGVGVWRNTAPITSITFTGSDTASGAVISLYGLAGGQASAKASGGVITTSGAYTIHTFKTSGGFIPNENLTVDYLVVAGGGGGGAGGGGAGGLRSTVTASGGTPGTVETALSLTANTSYPVIVGAGAIGGIAYGAGAANGSNGTYSSFSTIVSVGGSGGGSAGGGTGNPSQGGSGGGASYSSGKAYPGAGIANQGFAGGEDAVDGPPYSGPGGGGAGAAGNPATADNVAGAGGVGVAVAITGSSVYYAGGGGGYGYGGGSVGAGGNGGGGAGNAGAATANTGGGGGGAASGVQGGSGGSGIVIVRYLT
jgi:hypothetical protein